MPTCQGGSSGSSLPQAADLSRPAGWLAGSAAASGWARFLQLAKSPRPFAPLCNPSPVAAFSSSSPSSPASFQSPGRPRLNGPLPAKQPARLQPSSAAAQAAPGNSPAIPGRPSQPAEVASPARPARRPRSGEPPPPPPSFPSASPAPRSGSAPELGGIASGRMGSASARAHRPLPSSSLSRPPAPPRPPRQAARSLGAVAGIALVSAFGWGGGRGGEAGADAEGAGPANEPLFSPPPPTAKSPRNERKRVPGSLAESFDGSFLSLGGRGQRGSCPDWGGWGA